MRGWVMQVFEFGAQKQCHLTSSAWWPLVDMRTSVCLHCSLKDTPGNKLAAKVLEKVFHKAPVFYRDGGTIPALAYFQSILGVNTTGFGFGLGDHIHAPNERMPVSQYHIGRVAWIEMLAELGQHWPAATVAQDASRRRHRRPSVRSKADSSTADEHGYDDRQEL